MREVDDVVPFHNIARFELKEKENREKSHKEDPNGCIWDEVDGQQPRLDQGTKKCIVGDWYVCQMKAWVNTNEHCDG